MTDDQKKMLTEWLGECWHELKGCEGGPDGHKICTCGNWYYISCIQNRTFTTWQDLGDIWTKARKEEWFWPFVFAYNEKNGRGLMGSMIFPSMIDDPEHFCRLVAEFLE